MSVGDQVGVIVGLISTSLQAIGLTLQRKSHILEDEKRPYELRRPPYKRRRWQVRDPETIGEGGGKKKKTQLTFPTLWCI